MLFFVIYELQNEYESIRIFFLKHVLPCLIDSHTHMAFTGRIQCVALCLAVTFSVVEHRQYFSLSRHGSVLTCTSTCGSCGRCVWRSPCSRHSWRPRSVCRWLGRHIWHTGCPLPGGRERSCWCFLPVKSLTCRERRETEGSNQFETCKRVKKELHEEILDRHQEICLIIGSEGVK